MPITYLHSCIVCGNGYSDQENTKKSEATCPTCVMSPTVDHVMDEDRLDAVDVANNAPLIFTKSKDGRVEAERLPSGLTGQHKHGTANHAMNKPHFIRSYKKKICRTCKKPFTPTGSRDILCAECKPLTVKKSVSAAKYVARDKNKKYSGPPIKKPTHQELRKLADGLISPPTHEVDRIQLVPTEDFPVGLTQVKKQADAKCNLEGYWVNYSETGKTREGWPYNLARNLIDGRVCIDVYKPTGKERYISA
jgi:hypothetical protein